MESLVSTKQMCGPDLTKYSVLIVACQVAELVRCSHFLHFEIPDFIIKEGKHINQFELYAILIATREWAPHFR